MRGYLCSLRQVLGDPAPPPLGEGASIPKAHTKSSPGLRPQLCETEDGLWLVVTGSTDHKLDKDPYHIQSTQERPLPSPNTSCLFPLTLGGVHGQREGGWGLGARGDPVVIIRVHNLCMG